MHKTAKVHAANIPILLQPGRETWMYKGMAKPTVITACSLDRTASK